MTRLLGTLAVLCLLTACPPLDPVWVTTDAIPAPVPADPSEGDSSTGALPTTSTTDVAAAQGHVEVAHDVLCDRVDHSSDLDQLALELLVRRDLVGLVRPACGEWAAVPEAHHT